MQYTDVHILAILKYFVKGPEELYVRISNRKSPVSIEKSI